MSRTAWFVAGAGAGVYAMTRVRRVAEALTPEGLGDRLAGLAVGLHLFREEVAAGMAERETGLREQLGLRPPGGPGRLEARGLDHPAGPDHPTGLDQTTTTREGNH